MRFRTNELRDEKLANKLLMDSIIEILHKHSDVSLIMTRSGTLTYIINVLEIFLKDHGLVCKLQRGENYVLAALMDEIDAL